MPKFRICAEVTVATEVEAEDEAQALKMAEEFALDDMDMWADELCPKCDCALWDHFEGECEDA